MILFWIVLIEVILIFACIAKNSGTWATVSLIISLLLLQFLTTLNVFGYIIANPLRIILYAFGYLIAGIIWSFAKWYMFLVGKKNEYEEKKKKFLEEKSAKNKTWPEYAKTNLDKYPLEALDHKWSIIRWMSYWPISLVWSVIDDLVEKILRTIWNLLKNIYQKISDRVFKNIRKELN
jgi:predicted membrane protein